MAAIDQEQDADVIHRVERHLNGQQAQEKSRSGCNALTGERDERHTRREHDPEAKGVAHPEDECEEHECAQAQRLMCAHFSTRVAAMSRHPTTAAPRYPEDATRPRTTRPMGTRPCVRPLVSGSMVIDATRPPTSTVISA
jgi:hypothetical protein